MSRKLVVVLLILCACAAVWAGAGRQKADEAESLIARGLSAYQSGKAREAISHLQKAIAAIQESLQKGLAAHFPKAPRGWEAGKVKSQSLSIGSAEGSGAWRQVSRTYTRKQDKLKVTVTMTDSPQLIQAQEGAAAAYRNPQMLRMLNQDPNTRFELIDEKGWFGWTVIEKGRNAQATAFREGCLLTVQVSKDDEKVLKMFWKGINLKALAAAGSPATKPAGK